MHWPNPANPSDPEVADGSAWPGFGPVAALAGSVFLAGVLGIALTRQSGRIAAIWLANAVVVLPLLRSPGRRWPVLLLCGLAGNLAADRVLGDGDRMALVLSLCNTVEIVLVGWLFRLWDRRPRTDLTRMPSLLKFIAVAGLLAPATGAALSAMALHLHLGTPFGAAWRPWYTADALGLMVLVPLLAGLGWADLRSLVRSNRQPRVLAGLVLIPVLTIALVANNQLGLLFLLSPLILWAVFTEGFTGAALAIFLTAASAITTLAGLASRPEFAGQLRADIYLVQVFLFTLVVIFLPIANLLRALRDGDARFRIMIEQAPEAILVYDLDRDRFVDANRSAEKLFGCPRERLLESGPRSFLPGAQAERETFAEHNRRALAGEEVRFERQLQVTDATIRFCEVRLTRLLPAEDRLIRVSMLDITERKLADQRLERALAELRTLLNTLPDLIWLKDPDGLYLRCNHRFEQMFGAPEAEIAGRTDYDFVDRAQADFFRSQDRVALAKGGPHAFEEMVRFAGDGHEELLETIKTPVTTADGQLLGILGIGRDITGRQRSAELQKKLDAELHQAQKLDSLGSLAGGVAHDMNNVLAAIQAVVQTLKWDRGNDPDLAGALELIDQASTRGRDLVKGLTNFARRDLSEPELLDLNELVRTEVDLLRRTTLQKLELVMDLEQPLPAIMGERGTLGSALMNLCVNAVDAMPHGGTLTLRTRRLGAMVGLEVQDTGDGMSPEVAARAMEPFFTTKPIGKGTGLGLASVYVTAKAHGGSVDIQSTPGAGTSIQVKLPARSEDPAPAPAEASQPPSAPLRVLLVDDDELIRFTVPRLVELLGHQVIACAGGREALDLLETGRPMGLVILDLNMPGMDGAETLGRIRQLRPDLPVLVATGHLDAETAELLKADPKVSSIAKPFTLADLDRKIQEFS